MPIAHVTGNLGNCDKTWGKEQKEEKLCLIWGGSSLSHFFVFENIGGWRRNEPK